MEQTIRVNMPDGRVVNFPATMSQQEITQALSSIEGGKPASAPAPQKPSGYLGALNAGLDADLPNAPWQIKATQWLGKMIRDNPVESAATAGGVLAAPLTGGMSVPAALGLAGLSAAGGAGAAIAGRQLYTGKPENEIDSLKTIGTQGAMGAAGEGAGRLISGTLRAAAPHLKNVAVSAYERMLKPNKSTIQGISGMGNSLQEKSRNVAEALIQDPNGRISKTGANAYDDATREVMAKVDELVDAKPEARGSTSHLKDALDSGRGTFKDQWAPNSDVNAYDNVAKEVLENPQISKHKRATVDTSVEHELGMAPAASEVKVVGREPIKRVTAAKARNLTQGTYRNLGDKAYGELKGPAIQANKAAARGGRAILNEAIPEVEPLNNTISRRIDLGQVLDDAVFRSGKHDPIGLAQQVVLSGNAGWIPASLINRPGVGSSIARGLYGAGNKAGAAADAVDGPTAGLLRKALMAALAGEQTPE